ncbi:MAG: helix-turn-helix domain-containing protein [Nitrososphaerota archaeon]
MGPELTMVLIFSILFVAQTILYTMLLLRLKKKVEESLDESRISQDTVSGLDEGKLNESIFKALEILSKGSLSAREVSRNLGLSREHTARLLKKMVETGLVIREGKPYRYMLTPSGRAIIEGNKKR